MEDENITLSELSPFDIFDKRMENEKHISNDMTTKLNQLYREVLTECENENN